jgi:hypothetical protein
METTMKVFRLAVFVLAVLLCGRVADTYAQSPSAVGKATIALLAQDQVPNNQYPWQTSAMAAAFENELVASKRFRVVSQSIMDAALKQQGIAASSVVDPAQAIQIGKIVQAKYVVVLKQIRSNVLRTTCKIIRKCATLDLEIQAQVINIETTEVAESKAYTMTAALDGWLSDPNAPIDDSKLGPTYSKVTRDIAKDFVSNAAPGLDTTVIEVGATQVILDGGNNVGLAVGAEFELFREKETTVGGRPRILRFKVARVRVARVDTDLSYTTILKTFDDSEMEDAVVNPGRIKVGALARYAPIQATVTDRRR